MYTTAKWAIPLLQKNGEDHPTFLVTSSLLWQEPITAVFSLSMVKSSQRNLAQSMQMTYPDVHIPLIYVADEVSPESEVRSPDIIAKKMLELYTEKKGSWTNEVTI